MRFVSVWSPWKLRLSQYTAETSSSRNLKKSIVDKNCGNGNVPTPCHNRIYLPRFIKDQCYLILTHSSVGQSDDSLMQANIFSRT